MLLMKISDARKAFEQTDVEGFAKEMDISIKDATHVLEFISRKDIPADGLVLLSENIF